MSNIVIRAVVMVGFEEAVYTVSEEDKEIEVCVSISSPTVVDLSVIAILSTSDDSAKGTYTHCVCKTYHICQMMSHSVTVCLYCGYSFILRDLSVHNYIHDIAT